LEREREGLERRGVRLVAVGPSGDRAAAAVASVLRIRYPVIGDPKRQLYDRFGYRRVLAVLQESGSIVVDARGIVRLVHRGANPAAALPWPEIVRVLDEIAPPR
jgi:alkyl hydroperoxide reductase subunit AhpC